jgi:NAD+ synthase
MKQQIGATYPELKKFKKNGEQKPKRLFGRDLEVYQIFSRMHKAAQHKMNPIPVCDVPEEWRS